MGVGLVRSLQPPDILWIHWRVYNFIANTSKGVLFLPPSDAYVRSFLYLLYTLIKLYYTKALSNQVSSLSLGFSRKEHWSGYILSNESKECLEVVKTSPDLLP